MTPETRVKNQYLARIKQHKQSGVMVDRPYVPGQYGEVGWPDRDGCVCGLAFYVEFKAGETAKMRGIQHKRRDQIKAAGGAYFCVYDEGTLQLFMEWLDETVRRNT